MVRSISRRQLFAGVTVGSLGAVSIAGSDFDAASDGPDAALSPPRGVVAAGLEGVWRLRSSAGLPGRKAAVSGGAPGWAREKAPSIYYSPQKEFELTSRAISDGQVLTRGNGVFRACSFNNKGVSTENSKLVGVGDLSASSVRFEFCEFSGEGMRYYVPPKFGAAAMVMISSGSSAKFYRCRFDQAPLLNLKSFGDNLNIEECFFGKFGFDPGPDSHMESVFLDAGSVYISRSILDPSGYYPGRGITGILNVEAKTYDIDLNIDQTIICGSRELSLLFPCQVGGKGGRKAVVRISNSVWEMGSSGYIGVTQVDGGEVRIVDGGGNRDLKTGRLIDLSQRSWGR